MITGLYRTVTDEPLLECPECLAIVAWRALPEHEEWHDEQDEAPLTEIETVRRDVDALREQIEDALERITELQQQKPDVP